MRGPASFALLMTATLLVAGISLALDLTPPENEAGPDQVVVTDDLDEVAEALRTLDAAGVPPSKEELARFLEEAGQAKGEEKSGGHSWPFSGSVLVRSGHYQYEGLDHYGKFSIESRWLRCRARVRQYRYGLQEVTGTVELGGDSFEMRMGDVGLVQGYGLLIGAPGRGQSLTADSGLGPRTERMVTWLGPPDSRAVTGMGLEGNFRSWRLRMMSGRRTTISAGAPFADMINAVQLSWTRKHSRFSAAGLENHLSRGISLAGKWKGGAFSGSFETLAWRAAAGIPVTGAAILGLKWRMGSGAGLEGQWGISDLVAAPGLGSRPGVLPGWSGRGGVLRGFVRAGPGADVRALVHLGQNLDRLGVRNKIHKTLVDFQVRKRLSPRYDLAVRFRGADARSWSWSDRYRWQPPEQGRPQKRSVLSVKFSGNWPRWRVGCLVRSYALDVSSGAGRRSLFSLSMKYETDGAWKLRGSWVTAWGEPVDLVSAIVPVTGMVLPRHWGRWRSETVLGAEWKRPGVRVQAAGSWRQSEGTEPSASVRTLWLEAGFQW